MGKLEEIEVFVRVVESGGIGTAAEQLGIAKSAVSRRLALLEKHLGVKLINRTTRVSHLTEDGKLYYKEGLHLLNQFEAFNQLTDSDNHELTGTLNLSVPLSFGVRHLAGVVSSFRRHHPKLKLDIHFSDRYTDLIEGGFDLALRIGELDDSTLMAKKITPIRSITVASPAYLQSSQPIQNHNDLKQHEILQYSYLRNQTRVLIDPKGKPHQLKINAPSITANNGDFLLQMAENSQGISLIPTFIAYQSLHNGKLQQILKDYTLPVTHLYAVYPQTRFLARKTRLFIDFIAEYYGGEPYWDREYRWL